jgi:PRELI-like family
VPSWVLALTGGNGISYVREIGEVDPKSKTVVLKSVNLTHSNLLRINETCTYTPSPDAPQGTLFRSSSKIRAFIYLQRLSNKIEDWSADTILSNAKRGKEGFDSVLAMAENIFRRPEMPV